MGFIFYFYISLEIIVEVFGRGPQDVLMMEKLSCAMLMVHFLSEWAEISGENLRDKNTENKRDTRMKANQ